MRDEETWEQIETKAPMTNEEMLAHILAPRWQKGPPKIEGEYLVWNGMSKDHCWLQSDGNSLQVLIDTYGSEITSYRLQDISWHFPVPHIPEK